MPLMPMPPIPTKWMGPMSRGSRMQVSPMVSCLLKTWTAGTSPAMTPARGKFDCWLYSRHFRHEIGEPLGGIEPAGRARRRCHGRKPGGLGGEPRNFGGETIGRELALRDPQAPARLRQHAGICELVLIDRSRQRHQDRGP